MESKVTTWVPKAQAREARAKAAGRTRTSPPTPLPTGSRRVQNRETKVNARLAKAQAACSAAGSTGTTAG